MGYNRVKFNQTGFDAKAYKKYFAKNQVEYIRIKLRSVKLYSEGNEFDVIAQLLMIHEQSVRKYINIYIKGGFESICQKVKRPQKSLLTDSQSKEFKDILLGKRPSEVGLLGNIWTGQLMCEYLKNTYNIDYKSGIYDLLERLNLSHQKAHSDYGNAKIEDQKAFIAKLKQTLLEADDKTAVVKFDEFSICEKPSSYYGWAEKNTRPQFTTNEKKEVEQMAC
jgi:transposase